MIFIGVIIIVALILIGLNIDRLVDNTKTTNKYLNDINSKLENILEKDTDDEKGV